MGTLQVATVETGHLGSCRIETRQQSERQDGLGHASSATLLDGESLTVDDVHLLASDPQRRVALHPLAIARITSNREALERAVARYETAVHNGAEHLERYHIYGVTTGFGEFKMSSIPPQQLLELQSNLIRSHAAGVGRSTDVDDLNNYLDAATVRATLLLRANSFCHGASGVRHILVQLLCELLNHGVVPLVPTRGSLGASGDLCPLAHLGLLMLGDGIFYQVSTSTDVRRNGRGATVHDASTLPSVIPALAPLLGALEQPGVTWPMLPFSYKEGLAFANGVAVSTAMFALALKDASSLAATADATAALTLEAMCGQSGAFDGRVHAVRGHPGQAAVATRIRSLTAGSGLVDSTPERVQDSYSLRCVPQVHGVAHDMLAYAAAVAVCELNAATDNPLLFAAEDGSLDVRSAGNFHGQPVAVAADCLAIVIAELGSISERRTQMLLDAHHNRGLPPNLTESPGVCSGLMIAQYTAASLVSENKGLAHPASVDSIPTAANTEDHVSMSLTAARKLRTVMSNTQAIIAIELVTAAQAVDLRIRQLRVEPNPPAAVRSRGGESIPLGTGTGSVYALVRSVVPMLIADRRLDGDIRATRRLVESGEISRAVMASVHAATSGIAGETFLSREASTIQSTAVGTAG